VVRAPDSAARLHLYRRGFDEPLTEAVHGQPALAERAAQVCRDTRVPLALLTNGRFWVLVHARPGEATSTAVFDADLWLEEPTLLRAFASLCCASRVLPPPASADGAPSASLAGLFARSADEHIHVTTTLGHQVRQAVELFVAELARLDREAGGALLGPVRERDIYRGALTALMRLVFLLFAEEQRLLPVTDPIYADGYPVSTLYEQLEVERNLHGDEVTDRRTAAWPRRPRRAAPARPPQGRCPMPVRGGPRRHGGRAGQAVAVAGHAGQEQTVRIPRPRAALRGLAGRPDLRAPGGRVPPRSRTGLGREHSPVQRAERANRQDAHRRRCDA
jgi:hypothetical protein